MKENKHNSLAIIVASCDKYSDLWTPFFFEFFKNWTDNPYPVYLVSNHKSYDDSRVHTLLAGDDLDWSSTVLKCIDQISHTHCLFLIDDAFLSKKVENHRIMELFDFVSMSQANFLRLRSNPIPSETISDQIGVLGKNASYRVSLFATIWKIETLRKILKKGESAWEFELNGTDRSKTYDAFYSVRQDVFQYQHGVERGVWIRPTAFNLERAGYKLNYEYRPLMSKQENVKLKYRLFKSWILHRLPERYRTRALEIAGKTYRFFGLRNQ